MNISNVVLDRDKRVVTFDMGEVKDFARCVGWLDGRGWMASEDDDRYTNEISDYLKGVLLDGLSLENLSMFGCTFVNTPKPDQDITPDYYNKTYKGVKVDYYRVAELFDLGSGPRAHAVKYLLRGTNKDGDINTELELIKAVRKKLDRWEEMIKEDAE